MCLSAGLLKTLRMNLSWKFWKGGARNIQEIIELFDNLDPVPDTRFLLRSTLQQGCTLIAMSNYEMAPLISNKYVVNSSYVVLWY